MWGWLGSLASGIGSMLSKGASSVSSGLSNTFGSGVANQGFSGITSMGPGVAKGAGNFGGNAMSGLGKLFTGGDAIGNAARGLGMMGASQLIPNAKPPAMPDSYNKFMDMMQQGGTPGMQSANQYYQNVLNGNNQNTYDAATYSLDLNYREELRKMNAMYKSLRPGTDPTSDSTYQRDLAQLNDQYSRARAQTMAQVQQGAASGAAGVGVQQMGGLQSGIQAQLDQIAAQWGMNASQRENLRNQMLGLGSSVASNALDPNAAFNKLWQKKMMQKMLGV